jgi:hypothetical protein
VVAEPTLPGAGIPVPQIRLGTPVVPSHSADVNPGGKPCPSGFPAARESALAPVASAPAAARAASATGPIRVSEARSRAFPHGFIDGPRVADPAWARCRVRRPHARPRSPVRPPAT